MNTWREEDEVIHEKAIERKLKATQRLIGSSLLGIVGLVMMVRGENVWIGLAAAGLGWGLLTVADLKELRN